MSSPLFAAIELRLAFETEVPEWISGKALHGLAFRYMRAADATLSERIHAKDLKPFTISLLRPVRGSDLEMRWRWTVLDTALYEALSALLYREWRTSKRRKLVGETYALSDCQMDGGGRSILWRPDDLVESALPDRKAAIRLVSPTAFKSGGKQVSLFPEPGLVWGGIARRLEKLAPGLPVDPDTVGRLNELRVSRYHLGTRQLEFPGFVMKGVQGRIAYDAPPSWRKPALRTLAILLQAAPFLGVGTKTAHGMGQCRLWKESP